MGGACGHFRSAALTRVVGENARLSGVIVISAVIAETMISIWRCAHSRTQLIFANIELLLLCYSLFL